MGYQVITKRSVQHYKGRPIAELVAERKRDNGIAAVALALNPYDRVVWCDDWATLTRELTQSSENPVAPFQRIDHGGATMGHVSIELVRCAECGHAMGECQCCPDCMALIYECSCEPSAWPLV